MDAKSVSVSASSPSTTTETRRRGGRTTNPSASTTTTTDTLTLTSPSASSSSFVWEDAVAEFDYCNDDDELERSAAVAQSFSGLLRELGELEQSVASWGHHRDNKEIGRAHV